MYIKKTNYYEKCYLEIECAKGLSNVFDFCKTAVIQCFNDVLLKYCVK